MTLKDLNDFIYVAEVKKDGEKGIEIAFKKWIR